VHATSYTYDGDASPQSPGGIATLYRHLVADDDRLQQVVQDVVDARERGRHSLVLTQWTSHLERLTVKLTARGHGPVVLRGGMGTKQRAAALAELQQPDAAAPLLVVATGPFVGEGFDCPALDTLFLAAPIAFKGRLVQYVGRILRPHPGKTTAKVHDYHDVREGVLASSLGQAGARLSQPRLPRPTMTAASVEKAWNRRGSSGGQVADGPSVSGQLRRDGEHACVQATR
jgi:hypothetical protein